MRRLGISGKIWLSFSVLIAALRNSTGVDVYTTVPIAIYPADWKDQ